MLSGIERRHLDGGDGLEALRDRVAHHPVHVALMHQRAGMAIVRTQNEIPGVDAAFGHRLDFLAAEPVVGDRPPPRHAHGQRAVANGAARDAEIVKSRLARRDYIETLAISAATGAGTGVEAISMGGRPGGSAPDAMMWRASSRSFFFPWLSK